MIKTVSDLLERILEAEQKKLAQERLSHGPTIGAMYEGLTRQTLSLSLPLGLDLDVVSGFVEGAQGELSAESDVMVVFGKGRRIPFTDKWIFPVNQVIAVIEVKKNLFGSVFSDAFENLYGLLNVTGSEVPDIQVSLENGFQDIARIPYPEDYMSLSSFHLQVWHILAVDRVWPVRILFGYYGFKSEYTFRRALVKHFEAHLGKPGSGPRALPLLIMNRHVAAVKNVGMPWYGPIETYGKWHILSTAAGYNPAALLLEAIWTRLAMKGMVDGDVFGEDLDVESWHRFIDAEFYEGTGWGYTITTAKRGELENRSKTRDWEPNFVSEIAFIMANHLCLHGFVDTKTGGYSQEQVDQALGELFEAGIAARDHLEPNIIRLLTRECACLILPDGRFAVGENRSGRVYRWAVKEFGSRTVVLGQPPTM